MKTADKLLLLCATAAAAQDTTPSSNATTTTSPTVHWSPPVRAPANATAIDKGYIGFGIEMKSFPQYAGLAAANALSAYLLSQLSARTGGAPVHVRVGGTSMDNSVYDASSPLAVNATGNLTACRLHTNVTIGPPWLDAFRHLSAGGSDASLRYTVQVPLVRKDVAAGIAFANACAAAAAAAAAVDGTQRLDAFEIGNEPNFYPTYGCGGRTDRPSQGWGPLDYAGEWSGYAQRLARGVDALEASGEKAWFQALGLASNVNQTEWKLSGFWDRLDQGGYVKTISQHYYQGNASGSLKEELLTHSTTVSKMREKFGTNIAFAKQRNISFILGEVGSAIGGSGQQNPALYGTLGGALWTLDFLLHGMAMGIARVSMQLGNNFRISAWQPVDNPPAHPKAVHGNFYGLAAAAEFVGGAGDLQIRPLAMDNHPDVVGYAGYHGGTLTKVAALNLHVWNRGDEDDRSKSDISLTELGSDVTKVRVSRLTAPDGAAANTSVSWAGKRWTAENNGTEYQSGEQPVTIDVRGGSPTGNITVWASQAVLIEIMRG